MKKFLSVLLALAMLVSALALAGSALAATKPAKVTGVKGVLTVDRFAQTGTYKLTWKKQKGVSGYQIKIAEPDWEGEGNYHFFVNKKIKGASKNYFKCKDAYMGEYSCAFAKVRAYKKTKKGKYIYGKWSKLVETKVKVINQVTGFKGEVTDNKKNKKKITFSWNKRKDADGYQIRTFIFVDGDSDDAVKDITVKGGSSVTFTGWLDDATTGAMIRYYKIINGKKVFSDFSDDYIGFAVG